MALIEHSPVASERTERAIIEHPRSATAFNLRDAQELLSAISDAGRDNGYAPLTTAVVDQTGALLALARDDGASPLTAEIAVAKARTALLARMPSRDTENLPEGITEAARHLYGGSFVTRAGGLLVEVDGAVLGAVGVSGASSDEDEAAALAALSSWQHS